MARAVRDADAIAWCETHSFWPENVRRMRDVEPRMAAMLLTEASRIVDWIDFWGFALSLNAQGVSVLYTFATPERVRQAQRRGLTYLVWTVNDEAQMEAMVSAGVDSICSDFPDVVRKVVEGKARAGALGRAARARRAAADFCGGGIISYTACARGV